MAREWRRLLVAPDRLLASGGALPLEPEEAHYLRRVLRLRPGDRLAIVNGVGQLWEGRLQLASGEGDAPLVALEQSLEAPLEEAPPPVPRLALAVALPRLDADVLLRMGCELGVDRFCPLRAARSVAAERLRPERRQAILREAVEQCERLWLPRLDPEAEALAWLEQKPPVAAPGVDPATPIIKLLATTRRGPLPGLGELLEEEGKRLVKSPLVQVPAPQEVWVAIGPEGGWTPEEEAAAAAGGWRPVSLATAILRTSTAAVAAAVEMAAWRRGLGLSCGTSRPPSP
jgi:16S rRNA (uracil1498-N3)-methyltransferase